MISQAEAFLVFAEELRRRDASGNASSRSEVVAEVAVERTVAAAQLATVEGR
ncbi:MAG: hypothetical protein IRZ05_04785 [Micromonosporaceae bacterium]|jgi:hypothetical protein|nr:hypothetical protein [Micromonosporaceae bacterium]